MTFFFLKRKAVQVFSAVVTSLSRKHIGKPKNQTGEGKKEERGVEREGEFQMKEYLIFLIY